ncbi:MAG TPA: flagellar filament capping protein FliD [Phycisphaerae bacterium]|jgi:flagellar hook-associated protein 2
MSGISSGVGLISGLPTASIIEQLIAIEARPLNLVKNRITGVQAERTAYADLSARLLALKNAILNFDQPSFFRTFSAASSNSSVLTATAGDTATAGNYTFQVHSLVTNHQLIGAGFADAGSTPFGAGTLTIEVGNGTLHRSTTLAALNGGAGVGHGRIRVTDRSGATTDLDLTTAVTLDDVLEAFNQQTTVNVRARVSGDHVVIEDQTPAAQATTSLSIVDLGGGTLAAGLGIAGSAGPAGTQLTGSDLINLSDSTQLAALNDGNGVRRAVAGGDFDISDGSRTFHIALDGFLNTHTRLEVLNGGQGVNLGTIRITDRSGASAEVDLTGVHDIGGVVDAINNADVAVTATAVNSRLQINDSSGASTSNLKIEDVSGTAARDLGIVADVASNSFSGSDIYRIATVGDVLRAINYSTDAAGVLNDVATASISSNGNGLTLQATAGAPLTITPVVQNGVASGAAQDLGLPTDIAPGQVVTTRDLLAGLNTVLLRSLRGGQGVNLGTVSFTARNGTVTQIDFSGAQSVQDLIDRVNNTTATSGLTADLNPLGNGIRINDTTGGTAGPLIIADSTGTTAADLGIAGSFASGSTNSGNLQLQYVSEATRLADLNNGRGVRAGQLRITARSGASFTVTIGANQTNVGDVLRLINTAAPPGVSARINDQGDGILVSDSNAGGGTLHIENVGGGQAATDLNLTRPAGAGGSFVDGSFEYHVEVDQDDTLNDVVAKLNNAGAPIAATLINDGSSTNPFRLSITSGVSGRNGFILLDGGAHDLGLQTLVEGQDAVVVLGGAQTSNPILITSPNNTLSSVIPGVTLNLISPSDTPVNVAISQNVDGIVDKLKTFVTGYNAVISRIDDLTKFDSETNQRGVLLGDATVGLVRDRLFRTVTGPQGGGASSLSRLSAIGFKVENGGQLALDEDKFRAAYAADPAGVEALFTTETTGFGDKIEQVLDDLTRSSDGLLARQDTRLSDQQDLLTQRADTLQALLDRKRAQLQKQFQGLETALAALQSQQSSLAALTSLASQA